MAMGRASLAALLFGFFVVAPVLLQKRSSFRGPADAAVSVLHNSLELAERELASLKIRLETSSATSSRLMRENVRLQQETGRLETLLAKLPSRTSSTVEAAATTGGTAAVAAPAKPAEPNEPMPSGYRTPSALSRHLLESTEFTKEVPPPSRRHAVLCPATRRPAASLCRSAHNWWQLTSRSCSPSPTWFGSTLSRRGSTTCAGRAKL